MKDSRKLKNILLTPKYKDTIQQETGIKYWYMCDIMNWMYIGESSRTFGKSFKEHLKAPSPIHSTTDHTTTLDNFNLVGREGQDFSMPIKKLI